MSTLPMYCIANIIVLSPPPVPTPSKLPSPKIWGRVTSPKDESGGGCKNIKITCKIICRLLNVHVSYVLHCKHYCSVAPSRSDFVETSLPQILGEGDEAKGRVRRGLQEYQDHLQNHLPPVECPRFLCIALQTLSFCRPLPFRLRQNFPPQKFGGG